MNVDHVVPAFQPETAYRIFMRTIKEQDVATGSLKLGKDHDHENYYTHGPASVFDVKIAHLPTLPTQCYLGQLNTTCTLNQSALLLTALLS